MKFPMEIFDELLKFISVIIFQRRFYYSSFSDQYLAKQEKKMFNSTSCHAIGSFAKKYKWIASITWINIGISYVFIKEIDTLMEEKSTKRSEVKFKLKNYEWTKNFHISILNE